MNVHSIKRGRPVVDDKRRRILDAALATFAERGYHGTAVPEVAQAAKVSTGTLYHYFASKEVLVNEVYRDAKTRLRAALLEVPKLDLATHGRPKLEPTSREGANREGANREGANREGANREGADREVAMPAHLRREVAMPAHLRREVAMPAHLPREVAMPAHLPREVAMPARLAREVAKHDSSKLETRTPYAIDRGKAWFTALWSRLGAFARVEPDAFRFLEMQDHAPYLDAESRALELSVLAPLWLEGQRLTARGTDAPPVDVAIALLWGAFVGLIKASRLGYLKLDDASLAKAGAACWRMIAPQLSRTGEEARAGNESTLRTHEAASISKEPRAGNKPTPRSDEATAHTTDESRSRSGDASPRAGRAVRTPKNPRSPRRTSKG